MSYKIAIAAMAALVFCSCSSRRQEARKAVAEETTSVISADTSRICIADSLTVRTYWAFDSLIVESGGGRAESGRKITVYGGRVAASVESVGNVAATTASVREERASSQTSAAASSCAETKSGSAAPLLLLTAAVAAVWLILSNILSRRR